MEQQQINKTPIDIVSAQKDGIGIVDIAKKYLTFENNKKELEKILEDQSSDEELKKMAENELIDLKNGNLSLEDRWPIPNL